MIEREMTECSREAEVLEAVAFGRWPDHGASSATTGANRVESKAAELVAHVATCGVCADLVEVARALHDDREAACHDAQPPSAGMVWWRATIRARVDAARTATQPITVAQGVAGACAAGLTCGLAGLGWRSIHWAGWSERLGEILSSFATRRADFASASMLATEHALPLLLGLAACLVLAPLALYITLADD